MAHSEEYPDGSKIHRFFNGPQDELAKKLGELSQQAIERGATVVNQKIVCDNDRCPCGSDLRFDMCCKSRAQELEGEPK